MQNHGYSNDWDVSRVKYELDRRGHSIRRLSIAEGMAPTTAHKVLTRPYRRFERVIARVLGLRPQDIWGGRYDADGNTLHPHGDAKRITRARGRNAQGAGGRR